MSIDGSCQRHEFSGFPLGIFDGFGKKEVIELCFVLIGMGKTIFCLFM